MSKGQGLFKEKELQMAEKVLNTVQHYELITCRYHFSPKKTAYNQKVW